MLGAELRLLPWEFWRMTPAELYTLVEGARRRDVQEWYRAAWVVAHLLKPNLKKGRKLTPEQLLPKGFLSPKKAATEQEPSRRSRNLK